MRHAVRSVVVVSSVVAALSVACAPDEGYVNVEQEMLDLELSGITPVYVDFEASGSWYARIYYNNTDTTRWLNVSPLTGDAGRQTLVVAARSSNYAAALRNAGVEIKIPGGAGVTMRVNQPAVPPPRLMGSLSRGTTGMVLEGPVSYGFQYDEESEQLVSFSAGGTTYSVEAGQTSGTLTMATENGSNSIGISMLNGRVYGYSGVTWTFADANSGIALDVSTVSFNFSYDNSEDRKLTGITRTETISMQDGVTLDTARTVTETLNYTYDGQLRVDSLSLVRAYEVSGSTASVSDTITYKLSYPTGEATLHENTMSVDLCGMLMLPEFYGTPFYSVTGFSMLGLTGDSQSSLPDSAAIEARVHSEEGLAARWPSSYTYTYVYDNSEIVNASALASYPDGTSAIATYAFSYIEQAGEE